jgi:uncharacterized protein YndB with AHSA1/START domain
MTDSNKHELTLTRIFDAPRELLWKAWTDESMLAKWWGPKGFTTPISELDPKPGGAINVVMEDSAGFIKKGSRYPMTGRFMELLEPERLVYTSNAIMNGKPIIKNLVTVTFEDQDGKTKMTLKVIVTEATPEAEGPLSGMELGWSQSLDKLSDFVKS